MIETIAYIVLGTLAVAYIAVMVAGLLAAWPWGIIGLIVLATFGALLLKVLRDRLNNPEDDYYSRNIDK